MVLKKTPDTPISCNFQSLLIPLHFCHGEWGMLRKMVENYNANHKHITKYGNLF